MVVSTDVTNSPSQYCVYIFIYLYFLGAKGRKEDIIVYVHEA